MSGPLAQRKVAEDYDVRPRRAIPFPLRVPAPAAVKNASVAVDLAVIPVAVAAAAGWGGGVPRGEREEHMREISCGLGSLILQKC